jgi:hypothetical protein
MLKFWYNVAMLSIESQRVVQLRTIKLAMATLLNGGSSNLIVAQYRSRVRSNSRRLSREYIE